MLMKLHLFEIFFPKFTVGTTYQTHRADSKHRETGSNTQELRSLIFNWIYNSSFENDNLHPEKSVADNINLLQDVCSLSQSLFS
jgi:hypothetical protein